MDSPFDILLHNWMLSLSSLEKISFRRYGLDSLFSLRGVKIEWDFLRAAACFWDPIDHVFRFNMEELCPTHEEFCSLLGVPVSGPIIFSEVKRGYVASFASLMGFSIENSLALISENRVDLRGLAVSFLPRGELAEKDYRQRRLYALSFCLVSKFLLTSQTDFGDIEICTIILSLSNSHNIIPMVLAETLNGLDGVHANNEANFTGSPLLLQMWLFDHLKLIPQPAISPYEPKHYRSRKANFHHNETFHDWVCWMSGLRWEDIRWFIPWWDCGNPILRSPGCSIVRLMGLHASSFYWATRVLRQMGVRQIIPNENGNFFTVIAASPLVIRSVRNYWIGYNASTSITRTDGPYELDEDYFTWLLEKVWEREKGRQYKILKITNKGKKKMKMLTMKTHDSSKGSGSSREKKMRTQDDTKGTKMKNDTKGKRKEMD